MNLKKSLLNAKLFWLTVIIILLLISKKSLALTQHEKLWLAVNSQQTLSQDKKWLSYFYAQTRLINESHPWQSTLFEGGIGYKLFPDESIWLGYRWSALNPNNGFSQENRLFQQTIWQKKLNALYLFILRSRIEEIERTNQNKIALRLRERFAFEIDYAILPKAYPFLYNEFFFKLNNTDYTSHKLITENRLLLGVNLYRDKHTWWEIGYMNQYQMKTPVDTQNQMSHILSVTYNFNFV